MKWLHVRDVEIGAREEAFEISVAGGVTRRIGLNSVVFVCVFLAGCWSAFARTRHGALLARRLCFSRWVECGT